MTQMAQVPRERVLILGGGRIGKRYAAILRRMGHLPIRMDQEWTPQTTPDCDRAIICTPTDMHVQHAEILLRLGVPVLSEKPLARDAQIARDFQRICPHPENFSIVCNWALTNPSYNLTHRTRFAPGHCTIDYQAIYTGVDGLAWDCCQLYYLAEGLDIHTRLSDHWACTINGLQITLEMIDDSYRRMLDCWFRQPDTLWGLNDAVAMTQKVEEALCGY